MSGDRLWRSLIQNEPLTFAELETLSRAREGAAFWWGHPRHYSDAALVRYNRAALLRRSNGGSDAGQAEQELAAARQHLEQALEGRPGYPQDWLRLAGASLQLQGDRAAAAKFLEPAVLTGANSPRMRLAVIEMAFVLWSELPAWVRQDTLEMVQRAWRFPHATYGRRDDLIRVAQRHGKTGLLELALADYPNELRRVQKRLRR